MTQITVKSINTQPVLLEVTVAHNGLAPKEGIFASNGNDLPT